MRRLGGLLLVAIGGCAHAAAPAPEVRADDADDAATAPLDDWQAPLPAGVTWQVVDAGKRRGPDGTFALAIEAPGEVAAGDAARFRVIIEPGDGYKINLCAPDEVDCTDYPVKLSLALPGTVEAIAELARDEVIEAVDLHRLVVAFSVTPTTVGAHVIPARLKFAVCQENACLPKRVDLRLDVAAR